MSTEIKRYVAVSRCGLWSVQPTIQQAAAYLLHLGCRPNCSVRVWVVTNDPAPTWNGFHICPMSTSPDIPDRQIDFLGEFRSIALLAKP